MAVTIVLERIKVNKHGYDAKGCYYGVGQTGHKWEVQTPRGGLYGHERGLNGIETRKQAIAEAMKAIDQSPWLKGLPVTVAR